LEILGVAGGRNGEKAVLDFVAQYGINYPIALLTQEFLDGFGGINAIPTTFLIDKKGNLVKTYVGYREKEVFVQDLTKLL
jgi:thioredoxin-related protein